MNTIESIKKIYIDQSLADSALVRQVESRAPAGVTLEYVADPREILNRYARAGHLVEKEDLLIYRFPGKFLSSCPGSDGMVCCQYFVINFGLGCLFDCHYCYLQSFLNNPLMTLFGNLEDLFAEVDSRTRGKNFQFRIGTGEYTDSLALDPLTGLSTRLVDYFAGHPNATLELKTKSANVEGLLDLDHRGRTVVAWSLNPPELVDAVEPGTASLAERLAAARQVQAAGYRLAFHLDPLIYFESGRGWERAYHELIEEVFDTVNPDHVAWISTGSFRYTPDLKETIQARFPEDRLTREGETIAGADGKHRYFKTIRQDMFRSIKQKIESVDPKLFLYLCMETRRMWQDVFEFVPDSGKNLDLLFEQRRQFIDGVLGAPIVTSQVGSDR
jgi:spore photoproduct lyase